MSKHILHNGDTVLRTILTGKLDLTSGAHKLQASHPNNPFWGTY